MGRTCHIKGHTLLYPSFLLHYNYLVLSATLTCSFHLWWQKSLIWPHGFLLHKRDFRYMGVRCYDNEWDLTKCVNGKMTYPVVLHPLPILHTWHIFGAMISVTSECGTWTSLDKDHFLCTFHIGVCICEWICKIK